MKLGYARVSTDDQHLFSQIDALKKAGCELIYEEKISSRQKERPELINALKALRDGDVLVVQRLDRLGRNLHDLIQIVEDLKKRKICFESLSEKIDTTCATGELIFHIFASLAQFERMLIQERTAAGLKAARARGRVGGRKAKLSSESIKEIKVLLESGKISVGSIAKRYGVSRTTLYRNIKI